MVALDNGAFGGPGAIAGPQVPGPAAGHTTGSGN